MIGIIQALFGICVPRRPICKCRYGLTELIAQGNGDKVVLIERIMAFLQSREVVFRQPVFYYDVGCMIVGAELRGGYVFITLFFPRSRPLHGLRIHE
eukprot:scaffold38043_cov176-Amphora_coffeaeformis.AAC.2